MDRNVNYYSFTIAFFYPWAESDSKYGTIMNKLAGWWTTHPPDFKRFSHCELVLKDNDKNITFTIKRNDTLRMIADKNYEHKDNYGFVEVRVSEEQYDSLFRFCTMKANEEQEFDPCGSVCNFLNVPPFNWFVFLPLHYEDKTFCSKIIAEAFIESGIFSKTCIPGFTSPNHLWSYLTCKELGIVEDGVVVCTTSAPYSEV